MEAIMSNTGVICSHRLRQYIIAIMLLGVSVNAQNNSRVYIEAKDLNLLVNESQVIQLIQDGPSAVAVTLKAVVQHPDVLDVIPDTIQLEPGSNYTVYEFLVLGKNAGHSEISFDVAPPGSINVDLAFGQVGVMSSNAIYILSYINGWIYFLAWTVSFYPQIVTNFSRKSVVGLNFDFVTLNLIGFALYSLFNCGLYYSEHVQAQYFVRYPRGHIPVQLNDVFFAVHATLATLATIIQCFIYERGDQRVSTVARCILGAFVTIFIITGILAASGVMLVLDFLYAASYIKLLMAYIKYVPQAYMNYKRKSTEGWSIINIFLDFTGGVLSTVQMMLNSWNYDAWSSFFGGFTKFGLGLSSLAFDVLFLLQHFYFYRDRKEFIMVKGSVDEKENTRGIEGKDYILLATGEKDQKIMIFEETGRA